MRQAAANFFLRLGLRIQGVPYKRNPVNVRGVQSPPGAPKLPPVVGGQGRPVTSTTPPTSTTQPKPPPPPFGLHGAPLARDWYKPQHPGRTYMGQP